MSSILNPNRWNNQSNLRIEIPTLAESATQQAMQAVEVYLYSMKELGRNPPDRDAYVKAIIDIRDGLRADLKALFNNFEPALQEYNRVLLKQITEHLNVCTSQRIIKSMEDIP